MARLQRDLARKTAGLLNTEKSPPRPLWKPIRTLVEDPGSVRIALAAAAVPVNFRGSITRR